MPHRLSIALLCVALVVPAVARADLPYRIVLEDATHAGLPIPTPGETPVEMVISGRTSTLKSIKIVAIGQKVPETYAGKKINNTPGFMWYVTRHFAMKAQVTKVPEKEIVEFLIVSELAYPHQVAAIGREPDEIGTRRMAIVYANTMEDLNQAVKSDLGQGYSGGGGGVTLYDNTTAYNYFTSGGLAYHRRDLVMHENTHMLEMCAFGVGYSTAWFNEGVTHAMAQHVYDQEKKQLTVAVLDRAPPNDFYDQGLRDLETRPVSGEDFYEGRAGEPYRPGVYLLFNQFCWTDPDRLMKWRLWRDEMFRAQGRDKIANNRRLMNAIFGPPAEFDRSWQAWIAARRNSFHYVAWGWEQEAGALRAYGWPSGGFPYSQMNLNYSPSEKVEYDPLRMDYPAVPVPAIVGEVTRDSDEPAMGCLIDFRDEPNRGLAGLALGRRKAKPTAAAANDTGKLVLDGAGVGRLKETLDLPPELREALKPGREKLGLTVVLGDDKESFVPILVKEGRELVVDGASIGLATSSYPLSEELKRAMREAENKVGMDVKIARQSLDVTLRAGQPGKIAEMKTSVPINAQQREVLMTGRMAVLAKDGYHRVTPFLDLKLRPEPDLSQPAPLGRWRFAGEDALYRLYRAAYVLGGDTPASLAQLKKTLVEAADKDPATQAAAMESYKARIAAVRKDVAGVRDPEKRGRGLAALLDLSLDVGFDPQSTSAEPVLVATLRGSGEGEMKGTIRLETKGLRLTGPGSTSEDVRVPAGEVRRVRLPIPAAKDDPSSFLGLASASLESQGDQFTLTSETAGRPSVPGWWVIGPLENPGGGSADVEHAIEKEPIDLGKTYAGQGGKEVRWQKVERKPQSAASSELVVSLNELYGQPTNVAAYAVVWIEAENDTDAVLGVGSEDGFVAWLNRERVLSVLKAPRTYASRSDQAPVHLRKGPNELLLKITLTQLGWKFSADLTDAAGRPLEGLRYTLEKPE